MNNKPQKEDSAESPTTHARRTKPRKPATASASPHLRASRRLYSLAVADANRARCAYTRHAEALQTALDDLWHAVEDMQRAALSIADMVYAEPPEADHAA